MKYLLIFCLFFMGCGSSTYLRKDKNGTITKITFKAVGKREFSNVTIDPEGKVEIGSSQTSGGATAEAMLNVSKMGVKAMGIPTK